MNMLAGTLTHRHRSGTCAAVGAVLLAFVLCAPASAHMGQLDRSFGRDGKVLLPVHLVNDWHAAHVLMARAGDGRFVVAVGASGDGVVVYRVLKDGSLDRSFGRRGTLVVPPAEGEQVSLGGLAVDSAGRIVLAGTVASSRSDTSAAIFRFDANGALDPSFGEGDGVVVTNFGAGPEPLPGGFVYVPGAFVDSLAIDKEGWIYVAGGFQGPPTAYCAYSSAYIARISDTGEPANGFGAGGVVSLSGGGHDLNEADGLTPISGGGLLYTGRSGGCHGQGSTAVVGKVTANGELNRGFGANGDGTVTLCERNRN